MIILDLSKDHSNTNGDGGNTSILTVDDEYDIVTLIKWSLEMDGQRVCTFTDAFAALDHFSSQFEDHHSIVISDIRMPGMNGYEFVRQVKKINPQVKIILMSAFEIKTEEFLNVLPDVKIDAFIQKPFSMKMLRNIVQKNSILL